MRQALRPWGSSSHSTQTWSSYPTSDAVLGAEESAEGGRRGRRSLPTGSQGTVCLHRGRLVGGGGVTAVSPLWGPELLHAHACVGACAGGFRPAWQLVFNSEAPPAHHKFQCHCPFVSRKSQGSRGTDGPPHLCGAGSGLKAPSRFQQFCCLNKPPRSPPPPRGNIPATAGCYFPRPPGPNQAAQDTENPWNVSR